jgi:hypothetical protein
MKRMIVFWTCVVIAIGTTFVPVYGLAMQYPVLLGLKSIVSMLSTAVVFLFLLMVVPPNGHADLKLRIKRKVTKTVVFGLGLLFVLVSFIVIEIMIRQQSMGLFDLMFSFKQLGGRILGLFYLMVALEVAYYSQPAVPSQSFFGSLLFRIIFVAVIVPLFFFVLNAISGRSIVISELSSTAGATGLIIGIVASYTSRPEKKKNGEKI